MHVHMTRVRKTPIGPVLIAGTSSGVIRIQIGGDVDRLQAAVKKQYPEAAFKRASAMTTGAGRAIERYFEGSKRELAFPVVLPDNGTDTRIWKQLRKIPRGQVRTYGAVAKAIRKPRAARVVGGACSRNPLPLYVPCHRVVAANRKLCGFSAPGGVDTKRALLELEGVTLALRS